MGRLLLNSGGSSLTESHKLIKHTHHYSNVSVTEQSRSRKDIGVVLLRKYMVHQNLILLLKEV